MYILLSVMDQRIARKYSFFLSVISVLSLINLNVFFNYCWSLIEKFLAINVHMATLQSSAALEASAFSG